MRELIYFQKRTEADDGFGNVVTGPFATVFTEPARLKPGVGSETVQAARLTGVQPFTVTVRSNSRTRQVTPAWRIMNARDGRLMDIKAIANVDERRMYLSIMAVQS